MNGIHDMGGMHGFGAVDRRPDDGPFPEAWQGRVCALVGHAMGAGLANIDAFRHAIERMPPDRYLSDGYYGRWLYALETLAAERLGGDAVLERPELGPVTREVEREPRFEVGDRVRTWNRHPRGHTRLPGYARDRSGVIAEVHPACVYPDANADGQGESPEYLYTVAFESRELWGEEAEAGARVYIDLFEPYLEATE